MIILSFNYDNSIADMTKRWDLRKLMSVCSDTIIKKRNKAAAVRLILKEK